MKRSLHFAAMALSGLIFSSPCAPAAVVVADYQFAGGSALSSATYPDANAGSFTAGSGFSGASFLNGWVATDASKTDGSEALAISGNDYFTFTITPTNGSVLNLSTLDFGTAFYGSDTEGPLYKAYYFVRSSIDNYAGNIGSTFTADYVKTSTPAFITHSVDLSGTDFQNLSAPVTFRIYIYDSNNVNAVSRRMGVSNVVLNASVIPEPATALLLGAGLAAIWLRRRVV